MATGNLNRFEELAPAIQNKYEELAPASQTIMQQARQILPIPRVLPEAIAAGTDLLLKGASAIKQPLQAGAQNFADYLTSKLGKPGAALGVVPQMAAEAIPSTRGQLGAQVVMGPLLEGLGGIGQAAKKEISATENLPSFVTNKLQRARDILGKSVGQETANILKSPEANIADIPTAKVYSNIQERISTTPGSTIKQTLGDIQENYFQNKEFLTPRESLDLIDDIENGVIKYKKTGQTVPLTPQQAIIAKDVVSPIKSQIENKYPSWGAANADFSNFVNLINQGGLNAASRKALSAEAVVKRIASGNAPQTQQNALQAVSNIADQLEKSPDFYKLINKDNLYNTIKQIPGGNLLNLNLAKLFQVIDRIPNGGRYLAQYLRFAPQMNIPARMAVQAQGQPQ